METLECPTSSETTTSPTTATTTTQDLHDSVIEKEEKSKRKTKRRFVPRMSCLRVKEESDQSTHGGFTVEVEGSSVRTHLVVMVNGLVGSAQNWRYAAKQFLKRYPQDVIVHCSRSNSSMQTFDGVDIMGERLAEEIIAVIKQRQGIQKISFVAHSVGGLVARYAIGRLYGQNPVREPSEGNGDPRTKMTSCACVDEKPKSKIAGLEPINFITLATPHLGSRGHKQVPAFGSINILEKTAHHTSWMLGRTGKHLMLADKDNGKPPLLLQMVNDSEDLQFMSALQSFRRCVAYANTCFDFLVGWRTSSIRRQNELPKKQQLLKNDKYPHIVNVEAPKADGSDHEDLLKGKLEGLKTRDMEELMIRGLTKLAWERVDVSFQRSKQAIMSHTTIQVKNYCINSDGADVILHVLDNFLL